jgi:hypothetical protein
MCSAFRRMSPIPRLIHLEEGVFDAIVIVLGSHPNTTGVSVLMIVP